MWYQNFIFHNLMCILNILCRNRYIPKFLGISGISIGGLLNIGG